MALLDFVLGCQVYSVRTEAVKIHLKLLDCLLISSAISDRTYCTQSLFISCAKKPSRVTVNWISFNFEGLLMRLHIQRLTSPIRNGYLLTEFFWLFAETCGSSIIRENVNESVRVLAWSTCVHDCAFSWYHFAVFFQISQLSQKALSLARIRKRGNNRSFMMQRNDFIKLISHAIQPRIRPCIDCWGYGCGAKSKKSESLHHKRKSIWLKGI